MPYFDSETIDEINSKIDILDLISEYVVLKKRGQSYQGLCPFHGERSPSFSVSPSKQLYHCFGCGAGGNGIKFLMEINKQPFPEVVLALADRYQVEIKTLAPEQKQEIQRQLTEKERLYEILAIASNYFQYCLKQEQGKGALNYLREVRGLSKGTIERFALGYSPAGWNNLSDYLIKDKHYAPFLVEKAGLIKTKKLEKGYYDYFRDRMIIPICDVQGRVIAFGGRSLNREEPKYLNSPETILFNKGKTLFCLDKAKSGIIKRDQVIVVEGYFDAIALHSVGIDQTVASLGTALSEDQVKTLLKYTESKQIILNFDGDKAGSEATKRAIVSLESLVYTGQVNLKVLRLTQGKDADEFLKWNRKEIFQEEINKAPLWLDWELSQMFRGKQLSQSDQFQLVYREVIFLLNKIEDNNQRTYYIHYCASLLSLGDYRLVAFYVDAILKQLNAPKLRNKSLSISAPVKSKTVNKVRETAEVLLLYTFVHYPEYRELMKSKDILFSVSSHRALWSQIKDNEQEINPAHYPFLNQEHEVVPPTTLSIAIDYAISLLISS